MKQVFRIKAYVPHELASFTPCLRLFLLKDGSSRFSYCVALRSLDTGLTSLASYQYFSEFSHYQALNWDQC